MCPNSSLTAADLQVEDLFGLLCLIDAAGLPHYSVPAVPDGKPGGLALLLSQILGTRAVDDLPLRSALFLFSSIWEGLFIKRQHKKG